MHSDDIVCAPAWCVFFVQQASTNSGFPCDLKGSFQQLLSIDMCRCSRIKVLPDTGLPLEYESTSLLCALQQCKEIFYITSTTP